MHFLELMKFEGECDNVATPMTIKNPNFRSKSSIKVLGRLLNTESFYMVLEDL